MDITKHFVGTNFICLVEATSPVDRGLAVESNMIANGIKRTVKNTVVAKSLMLGVILVARSFINMKKRMGLSKDP